MRERKTKKSVKENKLVEKVRSVLFSPTFNIIALVILLLSVFGGLRLLKSNKTQAQIKFVETTGHNPSDTEKSENRNVSPPEIFSGEVYDTSIRLRETGALGMAISLAVFGEVSERGSIPRDLARIWEFIKTRDLMPPGFEFNDGELTSATSVFLVRFQSQPFRFEILSSPKQPNSTPSIMMRFPLKSFDGRTITYFQTDSTNRFETPKPFAPLEIMLSSGWKIEQWRGEFLPNNKDQLNILAEEKRLLQKMPKDN